LTLTADSGTVAQPLKLDELAPTLKVHISPFFPRMISQATVATEPPAMVLPGLFAVNAIVLGEARSRRTMLDTEFGTAWLADGKTGVGWRGLTIGF
jgi:hypothetical protein